MYTRIIAGSTIVVIAVQLQGALSVADQASVTRVQQELRHFAKSAGHAPTDKELIRFASAPGVTIQLPGELPPLLTELRRMQKPEIAKKELADLVESKRASIRSLHDSIATHVQWLDSTGSIKRSWEGHFDFWGSGNKVRLDNQGIAETPAPHPSVKPSLFLQSYDGKVVRNVLFLAKAPVNAAIEPLGLRSQFYMASVLAAAGLGNSLIEGARAPGSDLVQFLRDQGVFILEHKEDVGGEPCLVATNVWQRAFLSPSRDFSLVRFEYDDYVEGNGAGGVFRGLYQRSVHQFKELKDCGNGIWLPAVFEQVNYSKQGKSEYRETETFQGVEVNKPISDSVFTDIFPLGIMVRDYIRGVSYRFGDRASIEKTLQEVALNKSGWRASLVILNAIALLVLVTVFVTRRLRKTPGGHVP